MEIMVSAENLKIVREHTKGVIVVKESTQFNSIAAERVEVTEGIRVRIFGTAKDIVLKKNSKVWVHGHITGNVQNEGGRLYIYNSEI